MSSSSDYSSLYISTVLPGPSGSPSFNAALPPHPCLQTAYSPYIHFASSPSVPSPPLHVPGCFSIPPASSFFPNSLRVLQWNAGSFCARRTELLHFTSAHPVAFICIKESNLNLSSSFRIPGFSALRSDHTHAPGLAFSLLIPRKLTATSSFLSGRAYSSRNFLPPLFLCLTPTLIT